MPSKSNKQSKSKAKSKLSSENRGGGTSPSPRTPSAAPNYQLGEEKLRSVVEEASRKFPALLGTNAFVGRIADVDSQSKGGSCRIWLSESSMLASSISPGSTVSVSLALPEGQQLRRSFPLSSLADECGLHFGVECSETQVEEAGNYFVLATVFPSCQVMKENVRLSTNLSHSLGSPASGRAVFVFPIRVGSLRSLTHGGDKMCRSDVDSFFVSSCGKLYLEPLPLNSAPVVNSSMKFLFRNSSDTGIDCLDNDGAQSPCTPSSRQSSVSSLHLSNLTHLKALATSSPNCAAEVSGSCDLKEIFENGSATKLLELCATSWLCNRTLLIGNIVTFPILSRLCVFRVTGSERITLSAGKDLSQSPDSEYDIDAAFIVDCTTKVSICLSTDTGLGALKKKVHVAGGIESLDNKPISGDEIQRVGGLRKEYGVLKDIISSSAKSTLSDLGLRTTKGVLLHGPPGTGKTSLAQLCARDAGFNIFKINGPEVISQYYGESEQELQKIFDAASEAAPSVIFIDELDAIAPARKEGGEELSQRMVATLLNLMDGINRTEGLLIIAATNRIESIEPALRRPGRLDREIEIGVPSPVQRLDILTTLLSSMDHSLLQGEIQHLATVTHGFVGADLAALCNEAAMECLRRFMKRKRYHCDPYLSGTSMNFGSSLDDPCCSGDLPEMSVEDPADAACSGLKDLTVSCDGNSPVDSGHVAQDTMTNVQDASAESSHCFIMEEEIEKYPSKVKFEDFEKAKMRIRPSAMREVNLEVPKVKWEDVGGQNEVKAQLMEAVLWPQKHQDALKRIGTRPPTGVLMFGPPGCSKTLMARAVASEAGLNFLAVKGPELFSKWVGESEKAVKSLFDKARANAPSVIFFDEIDSLAVIRGRESDGISVGDRVMSQLLVELDGLHERVDVTVVAATNRPDKIDPALRRPGRFDRLVYVGPPNEEERKDIFDIHLRKIPCHMDVDVLELACLTEGFTGADISLVCREAALRALEECLEASEIKMQHLEDAIEHVNPSEIESYDEMSEKFQGRVSSEAKSDVALASQSSATKDQTMGWNPLKWISKLLCRSPAAPL